MMGSPHLASRRWIWEQYDHMVMGDTVQRPGGDAAVVRVHGTQQGDRGDLRRARRATVLADPAMGTKQAVVETWRNLTAVGADPLAITDNMNFGNPERPEIMGQFVGSVQGMGEACRALDYPVVSGNVSLYNETNGEGIPPTPGDRRRRPDPRHGPKTADIALKHDGDLLILIGREEGHLGQSLYQLLDCTGRAEGAPPPVDLDDEIKAGNLVRALIREGKVIGGARLSATAACWSRSRRWRWPAAMASSCSPTRASCRRTPSGSARTRAATCLPPGPSIAEEIAERARLLGLPARIVGKVGGDALTLKGEAALPLAELRKVHEGWLPQLMG